MSAGDVSRAARTLTLQTMRNPFRTFVFCQTYASVNLSIGDENSALQCGRSESPAGKPSPEE